MLTPGAKVSVLKVSINQWFDATVTGVRGDDITVQFYEDRIPLSKTVHRDSPDLAAPGASRPPAGDATEQSLSGSGGIIWSTVSASVSAASLSQKRGGGLSRHLFQTAPVLGAADDEDSEAHNCLRRVHFQTAPALGAMDDDEDLDLPADFFARGWSAPAPTATGMRSRLDDRLSRGMTMRVRSLSADKLVEAIVVDSEAGRVKVAYACDRNPSSCKMMEIPFPLPTETACPAVNADAAGLLTVGSPVWVRSATTSEWCSGTVTAKVDDTLKVIFWRNGRACRKVMPINSADVWLSEEALEETDSSSTTA